MHFRDHPAPATESGGVKKSLMELKQLLLMSR
jgi:hypothetical protein